MTLLVTLVVVALFCVAAAGLIKKFAPLFYALAAIWVCAYLFLRFFAAYNPLWFALGQVIQKGLVAYAFFAVVMFIGVLGEGSRLKARLAPIRAELSLLGFILALGHVGGYLTSYLMTIFRDSGTLPSSVMISMAISLISLVLLVILAATTLNFLRAALSRPVWKNIQRLAYPFFALIHIHLIIMLWPALSNGAVEQILSATIYVLVLAAYAILRIKKARADNH